LLNAFGRGFIRHFLIGPRKGGEKFVFAEAFECVAEAFDEKC
jgi:hypothetical protein